MTFPTATLGSLSLRGPQYGANAKAVPRSGQEPRYIRITDIDSHGNLNKADVAADLHDPGPYFLREGDLLLARSGNTVGKSYLHSDDQVPAVFAGYLIRFEIDPTRANPRFVFHFTKSEQYRTWVRSKMRAAGQPNINGTEYSSLEIPLPPLPEQHRIVEILDQADALRQQRRNAVEVSRKILPALFHEMFGQQNTDPSKTIGEICTFVSGGTPSKSDASFWNGRIPWITPKDMKRIDLYDSADHVSEAAVAASRLKLLPAGTVLIVVRGMILARTCPVGLTHRPVTINQDMKGLIPNKGIDPQFLCWSLLTRQHELDSLIKTAAHGTKRFETEALKNLPVHVPSLTSQLEFRDAAMNQAIRMEQQATSSATLETLFQTLLHRAFDGSLTATWREAHAKEMLQEMEHQAS